MGKMLGILFGVAFLVLSLGFVSASADSKILVAGEVSDSIFGNPVFGADMTVDCKSATNGVSFLLGVTSSKNDGTYIGNFTNLNFNCSDGDIVSVKATKGDLEGFSLTEDGLVHSCNGIPNCDFDYSFAIVNVVMEKQTSADGNNHGGGGGGNRRNVCVEDWTCTDWSDCQGNLQSRSCQDLNQCDTLVSRPATLQTCTVNLANDVNGNNEINNLNNPVGDSSTDVGGNGLSGVTGAIVGTLGSAGTGLVIIVLVGLIVFGVMANVKKRTSAGKEKSK